jgi:mono/diheme cytochrome c family protein
VKISFCFIILFLALSLFSCASKTKEPMPVKEQSPPPAETVPAVSGPASAGQIEYNKLCLACHQQDGMGVRRQFPPLAGNELVQTQADSVIKVVLLGLQGPVTVNGQQYNQVMPAQSQLTDQQIADILTYIRSSWGNNAPAVSVEEVRKVRGRVNSKR